MSRFWNRRLDRLAPYVPGEQPQGREYVKLNTNENPYFPAKYAMDAVTREELEKLRLYSDPECRELTSAIAARCGVAPDRVLATNGSDEALAFCFAAFGERGACFADVTYGFYEVFAAFFGVTARKIPLNADFTVPVAAFAQARETVFLANPNAQTGIALPLTEVERIVRADPDRVVVVDEAYVDFGGESAVPLTSRCDNLVVVQTFSKSRSLAGARVGFAIAAKPLIADLNRARCSFNPYNVNRLSLLLAAAAIRDEDYFAECVQKIVREREFLTQELRARGYDVLPSRANFVLAGSPRTAGLALYEGLKARGVLVRHFADERIADRVRITVGTHEQMLALLAAIDEIEEERL